MRAGSRERPHRDGEAAMLRCVDVFRTPDERFEGLPGYDFQPNYAEVDGLRLHYVDEGPTTARPVVCFHGEPTWAYLYRKMLQPLVAAGHRVICPDYAGFGRSDKPTDRGWYTYDRHVERSSRSCWTALDLEDAIVVVQDWGGPIGLRWAVENADRVGALVILNTGLFTGRVSKGFMAWRDFAEKNPDLPVGFVIQGATTTELPGRGRRRLRGPVPDRRVEGGRRPVPAARPDRGGRPGGGADAARSSTRSAAGRSRRWSPSPTAIRSFPIRGPASASSTGSRPRASR